MYGISSMNNYYSWNYASKLMGMFRNQSVNRIGSVGGIDYAAKNNQKLEKIFSQRIEAENKAAEALDQYYTQAISFTKSFGSKFTALQDSASSLKAYSNNSVLNPHGYSSSNGDVASVTKDWTSSGSAREPISLDVTQIAAAQKDATAALDSKGSDLTGKMSLTFENEKTGRTTTLNFDFADKTSNKDALEEIAKQVNKSQAGVTASVVEKDGKSTLEFTSKDTGTDAAYKITASGSNTEALGLTNTQKAQNAEYSVNGEKSVSQSNKITLQGGNLDVSLKGTGKAELGTQERDDSAIIKAVKQFVSDYNDALSFASTNRGKSSAMSNLSYAMGLNRLTPTALSDIGIEADTSGRLSVNEAKMASALKENPDRVNQALGGSGGLASTAYNTATNAIRNSGSMYPMSSALKNTSLTYNKNMSYVMPYLSGSYLNMLL